MLLGGCFGNYHTAVTVARLHFASLDHRKASYFGFELAWLQFGESVCVRPLMADAT